MNPIDNPNDRSNRHLPRTVAASLDARLAPFHLDDGQHLDVAAQPARVVAPRDQKLKLRLVNDLKLLFAALGAGGSVVPLGENGCTARLLSNYAASLRDH
jgi:hypothetical protein